MPESILTQQRAEIAAIRTLIGQTTEEERALMERLAEDRRGASQRQQREHEELDAELARARAEADHALASQKATLEKRRELEPKMLKDKHTDRIEEIRDHAEELAETTKNKLNEAIWLAESVYEAAVPATAKRVEELHEKLDEASERLNELCEEAPRTLTRLRQQTEETFDDAGEDGDAVDPRSMIELVKTAEAALQAIRMDPKARWFIGIKPAFIVVIAVLIAAGIGVAIGDWSVNTTSLSLPIAAAALSIATLIVLYGAGQDSIRSKLRAFREAVATARTVRDATIRGADLERRRRESEIRSARDKDVKAAEDSYGPRLARVGELMEKDLAKERKRFTAVEQRLQEKLETDAAEVDGAFESTIEEINAKRTQQSAAIDADCKTTLDALDAEEQETMDRLHEQWQSTLTHFRNDVAAQRAACEQHTGWADGAWENWSPPEKPSGRVPIGAVDVDLASVGGDVPQNERLAIGEPTIESLPLCMTLPRGASMLVSTTGGMRGAGIAAIQNAVLRTLTSLPAGKAELTLIDPVALGQSFAGILHLADFDEAPLVDRAWTEPRHIESQLADLTEHMETVIQKYLRNEFESIDDYNEQAGEIAEPYRFLVIADFPVNISEQAGKRFASILTSGARCGVHVLMHRDITQELPPGIDQDTLEQIELRLIEHEGSLIVDDPELRSLPLTVEEPPSDQVTTAIIKAIGEVAQDTHRVEVPFRVIAPSDEDLWSRSTTGRLAVPLGRAGATKLQSLTLGRGTAQHALIAGKTGSGKSTLLHVLITNLALWYSPDEVEFYLVDFKKGVEFKTYATHSLPHARVVAVESDREFGISVLQRLDQELKARGERFRELGAQDIAAFREKEPDTPMPRILLVVDEFQEFFIDDDSVAQEANLLLDRLVRQGRAFGIHVLLGSQTLDGAYSLARSTMGQMAVRVALQCSEADSYIILDEDNAAARLLSRPGEAIYNDASGRIEGNSPFQIVWLGEGERDRQLTRITQRDGAERSMVVYEGNRPVHMADNHELNALLLDPPDEIPAVMRAWLGGAMAIKPDTAATFRAASSSNLLLVGQQEEDITAMVAASLRSIATQCPRGAHEVSMTVLDGTPPDAPQSGVISRTFDAIDMPGTLVDQRGLGAALAELGEELDRRIEKGPGCMRFLVINAAHRFRELRRSEDDFSFSVGEDNTPQTPDKILAKVLREGPIHGMHVILATDTLSNLSRLVDRQSIREFDLRVLMQMSANDSTNLIDSPEAARLGPRRALLFSEETGTIEPFRPYAAVDPGQPTTAFEGD